MTSETRRILTGVASIAVIIASCVWIYYTPVKTEKYNTELHRRIGEVMAEQTARLIGKKGRVVTIAIDSKQWPELKTQLAAYRQHLKKVGDYEVRDYEMDTKEQPKYGVGSGLSGRRYVRTVKKNENADVFVSFVGAPKLTDEEIGELKRKPKLIAEVRSPDNLPQLFEHDLIQVALVSRFQFPAPGPIKPRTLDEWFTKRYQILTAQSASSALKE
jgi:hypothetical protein